MSSAHAIAAGHSILILSLIGIVFDGKPEAIITLAIVGAALFIGGAILAKNGKPT